MTKFLIFWEDDMTRIPEDIEKQMAVYTKLVNLIKEDFKRGMLEWWEFVGGHAGYTLIEGTEQEVALILTNYMPYLKFKANAVLSIDQVEEIMKAQSKA